MVLQQPVWRHGAQKYLSTAVVLLPKYDNSPRLNLEHEALGHDR